MPNSTAIVLPAYNAQQTLAACIARIPQNLEADLILCDDASADNTADEAKRLNITLLQHDRNGGYGANQKTLYNYVLSQDYHYVIMLHPDDQYDPAVLPEVVALLQKECDFVMGNRMYQNMAKQGKMPWWRRAGNRTLNLALRTMYPVKLGEYHSGLRGFRTILLRRIRFSDFRNDYSFDSQMLATIFSCRAAVGEVPVQCQYTDKSSSPDLRQSVQYGLLTLVTALRYRLGHYKRFIK